MDTFKQYGYIHSLPGTVAFSSFKEFAGQVHEHEEDDHHVKDWEKLTPLLSLQSR